MTLNKPVTWNLAPLILTRTLNPQGHHFDIIHGIYITNIQLTRSGEVLSPSLLVPRNYSATYMKCLQLQWLLFCYGYMPPSIICSEGTEYVLLSPFPCVTHKFMTHIQWISKNNIACMLNLLSGQLNTMRYPVHEDIKQKGRLMFMEQLQCVTHLTDVTLFQLCKELL